MMCAMESTHAYATLITGEANKTKARIYGKQSQKYNSYILSEMEGTVTGHTVNDELQSRDCSPEGRARPPSLEG